MASIYSNWIFAITAVLLVFIIYLYIKNKSLKRSLEDTLFRKQSMSVKYGKMTEQFMPFMENYPYNPQNFRFIGTPIDGIQFEDDKIVFVEFKAGDSRFAAGQNRIRELVKDRKVDFRTIRIRA